MIGNLWPRKLGSYCIAIIVVLGVAGSSVLIGQQADSGDTTRADLQARITLRVKNLPLKTVIARIAQQARLTPMYGDAVAKSEVNVSLDVENLPVLQAFEQALKGTGLRASINGSHVLIERVSSDDSVSVAQGTITGRVLDSATRKGVGGVSITVTGTDLSSVTEEQGNFRIANVPIGKHTLNAKILGYQTRTIEGYVDSTRTATVVIILKQTTTTLSEVVTTATGQQRRVEIANDIVKINADEIRERAPVRNIAEMLEAAQVPGVLVTRSSGDPGAPSRIRMRGIKSISQSNDPVMIVDGVWVDAREQIPSPLDNLDPATIETIEVVRGPSAATLYGQNASNGVIVITTKKGRPGPTRWTSSYNRDWGQTYGRIPEQYAGFGYNSITGERRPCNISNIVAFECVQDSVAVYNPNHPLLAREGTETNDRYVVQMDGGTEAIRYALSATSQQTIGVRRVAPIDLIRYRLLGYQVPENFQHPSARKHQTITSSLTLLPRQDLTIGINLAGSQTDLTDDRILNAFGLTNMGSADLAYSLDTLSLFDQRNTVSATEMSTRSSRVLLGAQILWNPSRFTVNGNVGVERVFNNISAFNARTQCNFGAPCTDSLGSRGESSNQTGVYTARLRASTIVNLGRLGRYLEIRPSIGGDYSKNPQEWLTINVDEIPPGERSLTSGTFSGTRYDKFSNALAGWYLNSTIGVFRRIYFDVGIRQDIGSVATFSSSSAGRYPKLGGSWLVSEESFWPRTTFVSNFRLRGAMGYAPVQPDISDIYGRYESAYQFIDGAFVRSVALRGIGNPQLDPERALEIELGFDLDVWTDRISLIGTYAHSENRNALVQRTLAPSATGNSNSQRRENIARVRNRTFELNTTARIVETRNTQLRLDYTLTLTENIVADVGEGLSPASASSAGRIVEGYPVAAVWQPRITGYRDINGDGLLDHADLIRTDSVEYVGWTQPRVRAGYGLSLTLYNQVTLDARFAYQSQYIQNYEVIAGAYGSEVQEAPLAEQALALSRTVGKRPISDLRWSSASVAYRIPPRILRWVRGRTMSVSVQGSNLALWSNYAGRDPGVNAAGQGFEGLIDNGKVVPSPRRFVLTVNLGL